ncbi:MAG: nucleoside diphosphate kinase regulator [Thiobacillus sp.]
MEITTQPDITISERNLERLEDMLDSLPANQPGMDALHQELDRANIAPPEQMPPDVVTMNSRIRFVVEPAGKEMEMTLVYPDDFAGQKDQLPVTASAGIAMLGLAVGQHNEWCLPSGQTARVRIVDVTYQPERSGDYMR